VHCFALISFFVLVAYPFVPSSLRNTSSFVLRILIALPLFVFLVTTAGYASTRAVQFYADQCKPALPNNGVADDAAPLRTCMAAMPAGATMNLDGPKSYYFASHTSSDPIWGGDANCEISLRSQQTLNLNGATITPSSAEQAVPSNFMICAGTPSGGNTPLAQFGAAGNFIQINDTTPSATSVTVSTSASSPNNGGTAHCSGLACAGQFRAGDYIYIDCGVNAVPPAGDVDIFVGWDQVCGNSNTSTGVIPLCHPLLKPYTAAECTSGHPRIFDYNTSTANGPGGYGGPLATNITIENGTLNSGTTNGILLEGTVGALVTHINDPNMNPLATSGFLFANNNHLSVISYNSVRGPGCTGDTNFNAGEFTSSMNTITHNTAVVTGAGCTSNQGEKVFGDSEGDEANHYSYNTATVQAGGAANPGLSSCDYAYNTWGDTFDHENCTSAYTGFIDGPAGNSGQAGPTSVTNGTYVAANNNLTMQVPGDQVTGNTITETGGGIAVYLLGQSTVSNNVIDLTAVATEFGALAIQSGISGNSVYNSQIGYNVFNCLVSGGCIHGMYIEDPGNVLPSATLTIAAQAFSGFSEDIDLLGSEAADVPNQKVQGSSE
jgi:hypothetical protein